MGWQAEVADIRFNPFALSLEAEGFAARDAGDEPVTAFEQLRINVSFLQLVRGIIGFDEIRLTEPDIRLDLLPDHSLKFATGSQRGNPPAQCEATAQAAGADS